MASGVHSGLGMRLLVLVTLSLSLGCGPVEGTLLPDGGLVTAACVLDTDCHKSNPDECNICPAASSNLVCSAGHCTCACSVH